MRFAEAVCALIAVASPRDMDEVVGVNKSPKRPESAQPAAPNPVNEIATSCGQMAGRENERMVTHSNEVKGQEKKKRCVKGVFKRKKIFRNFRLCVFCATIRALGPPITGQIAPQ